MYQEARTAAHRRLLARLIALLDADTQHELLAWLEERQVLRDGQEDPGAVDPLTAALPLLIATEFQEITDLLQKETAPRDTDTLPPAS